jgi:hypothetical protein
VTVLSRMTVVSGPDLKSDAPARPGKLVPRDPVLAEHLVAAGRGLIRFGGGYALASGAGAVVCVAAKVPVDLDLLVVGACLAHGVQRASEGLTWHFAGGRAARRRRRKYQGEATPFDVRRALSPSAAVKKMARLAPALPAQQAAIALGTTVHRPAQRVAVSRAETILVAGVPQSIKTAWISTAVLEAPGTVLATSSRGDQYRHTVLAREDRGEVLVLDADGYGPGTNFAWSPVAGCADSEVAIRRAGDFMQASPRDSSGKDVWHEQRGTELLQWVLHAAALTGASMLDVLAWVRCPDDERLAKALRGEKAAPGWADALEAMIDEGPELLNSAVASAKAALGWLNSRVLSAVACPEPGGGLDIPAFLRAERPGTVYLIGSERAYGSLTPFFSAFVSEFMEQARVLAEQSGGRLPVPLTIAADEAATTARIDFKRWCAVTAGYNITVIAGLQALSQLSAWGGAEDQETIMTLFSTKVFAGGMTSPGELERVSVVCGERETWEREGRGKARRPERVYPPERLRLLQDMHALVMHRNCKPVQVRIRPVWNHPGYRPVTIVDGPPAAPQDTTEE